MSLDTATITGKLMRPDQSKWVVAAWITVDADGGRAKAPGTVIGGIVPVTIASDGTATIPNPLVRIPQTGVEPAGARYRLSVQTTDGKTSVHEFELTDDLTWDQIITTANVPVTSSIQAAAEAARDAAIVARDEAVAVGNTNDTIIAGKVSDTASATRAALSASFVGVPGSGIADYAVASRLAGQPNGLYWTTKEEHISRALGWTLVTDPRYGAKGDGTTDDTAAIAAAIAAAADAGSATRRQRVFFPPGIYLTDSVLAKAYVWIDFGVATIRKRVNGTTPATNSLLRALETQVAGSYYGSYKNVKITGGVLDPNGFTCPAHIVRLQFMEDLEMVGVTVKHQPSNSSWAFCIGGRRVNVDGLTVTDGTLIYQDGIHITHGQDITVARGMVQAGDDALSIGGEPASDAALLAEADGIARVTICAPVLNSARVSCIKIYVQDTSPSTWSVTDVNIIGAVGAAKGSVPVSIKDLSGLHRIKRVNVTDFSFSVGDSPNVASSAFPGQGNGVFLQGADNVTATGQITYLTDSTALAGWRHVLAQDCVRPDLKVGSTQLGKGGGYEFVRCTRAVVRGELIAGPNTDRQLVRLFASSVELIDTNLLGAPNTYDVVRVLTSTDGPSAIRGRGGKWTHATGASSGSGVGWDLTSDVVEVDLLDVDLHGTVTPLQSNYASLASLSVRASGGIRSRQGSTTFTGDDPSLPVLRLVGSASQTGNIYELQTSTGTMLVSVTPAGTMTVVGNITPLGVRASTRGSASAPPHTFNADQDTGAFSPADNVYSIAAGGVEALRLTSTPPALTYSRTGEPAWAAQLRVGLATLKFFTDSTTA